MAKSKSYVHRFGFVVCQPHNDEMIWAPLMIVCLTGSSSHMSKIKGLSPKPIFKNCNSMFVGWKVKMRTKTTICICFWQWHLDFLWTCKTKSKIVLLHKLISVSFFSVNIILKQFQRATFRQCNFKFQYCLLVHMP